MIFRTEPATSGEVLCNQADRLFRERLNADDADREGTFTIAGQSAGDDAPRGGDHIWLGQSCLHDGGIVSQGKQRVAVNLFAVPCGMDLDVATQHADGVSIDGLVESVNKAIV